MADDPPEITVLLLGDPECGKTTFLSRISQGSPNHNTPQPISLLKDIDQPFTFDIKLFNRPYRLKFYDTSSPTHWNLLKPDVIILCYSICSPVSLENAQLVWAKSIHRHFTQDADLPVLLLGLKRDLRGKTEENSVNPSEGHRVAQECRCDRYMECSAQTGELVFEVFEDICKTAAKGTKGEGEGLSKGGCGVM